MRARSIRSIHLAAVGLLLFTACGDDNGSSSATVTVTVTVTNTVVSDTAVVTDSTGSEPATTVASGVDFIPGEIEYRVVNLLDAPVDVYVRTDGFVEAFLVEEGLVGGEVSGFHAPPIDGRLVVTEAGAGDATCVIDCDHFLAELSAFAADGPVHTVVLYAADGQASAFDLWESPQPASSGNANAMPPADAANSLVVVTAIALTDAAFGLRLGIDGVSGCLEPTNLAGVLVGGNQTPAFAYAGTSADVLLFANDDRDCALEPAGGPFTVSGGPGTRSHLLLVGSPGAMDALVLPMR